MRLQVNPKPCERCGCFAFELDPERGLVCLLCSRALEPYVSTEPLLRDAPTPVYVPASVQASSGSVSRDELRAAMAAGRRLFR